MKFRNPCVKCIVAIVCTERCLNLQSFLDFRYNIVHTIIEWMLGAGILGVVFGTAVGSILIIALSGILAAFVGITTVCDVFSTAKMRGIK